MADSPLIVPMERPYHPREYKNKVRGDLGDLLQPTPAPQPVVLSEDFVEAESARTVAEEEARRNAPGVLDVAYTALRDPAVMSWTLFDRVLDNRSEEDDASLSAGFSYAAVQDEVEKDKTWNEVQYLRENGVRGEGSLRKALAIVEYRRGLEEVYGKASDSANLFGTLLAGGADPTALFLGLGIGGLLGKTALASGRLVAAGRPVAAAGSVIGENVVGELAFTALQDLSGEVIGPEGYATAAAGAAVLGTIPGVLAGRAGSKRAVENAIIEEARAMAQRQEVPPQAEVATVTRTQRAEAVVSDVTRDHTVAAVTDTPLMPRVLQQQLADEFEGKAPTEAEAVTPEVAPPPAEPVVPVAEVAPEPLTPERVLAVADEFEAVGDPVAARAILNDYLQQPDLDILEAGDIIARMSDLDQRIEAQTNAAEAVATLDAAEQRIGAGAPRLLADGEGNTIQATFTTDADVDIARFTTVQNSDGTSRVAPHKRTSQRELLQALVNSPAHAGRVPLIRAAQALLNSNASGLDGVVILRNTSRGAASPSGVVMQPVAKADRKPQRLSEGTDVQAVVDNMGDWAVETVVHEILHTLTQRVLKLAERTETRRRLSPETLQAVEVLEDILVRLNDSISPELRKAQGGSGRSYASKNVLELTAMAVSDADTQRALMDLPASTKAGGKWGTALDELLAAIKAIFRSENPDIGRTALDDVLAAIDRLIVVQDTARIVGRDGSTALGWRGTADLGPAPPQHTAMLPLWDNAQWRMVRDGQIPASPARNAQIAALTDGLAPTARDLAKMPKGVTVTAGALTDPKMKGAVEALKQLADKYLPDHAIVLSNKIASAKVDTVRGEMQTFKDSHVIGINTAAMHNPREAVRTLVHEFGHVLFHAKARDIPAPLMARMKADFDAFVQQVYANDREAVARRFSATSTQREVRGLKSSEYNLSFDEYTAEQFVKFIEQQSASELPTGLLGQARQFIVTLLKDMRNWFKDMHAQGFIEPDESFEEFFLSTYSKAERHIAEVSMSPVNPVATVGPKRRFAQTLYDHAKAHMAAHPIAKERLRVITAKIGGLSDGLKLAGSNNPILQMVASLVTETTTGAAGRHSTAAIRKEMLQARLTGNALIDYRAAYDSWKNTNRVSIYNDLVSGDGRRRFDRAVYVEILGRREQGVPVSADPAVTRAADALQALFTRALEAQKAASTLGSGRLPADSVGYVPQALDGAKLAEATPEDLTLLEQHFADRFANVLGWSRKFADEFAAFYINRARSRTMNPQAKDYTGGAQDGLSLVREELQTMVSQVRDPNVRAQAEASLRGLGQTKGRLDVGLTDVLPNGKMVLDFYEDNPLNLARRYVNRTAGTVALTEFGVPGADGVRALRDAVTNHAETAADTPTLEQLEAFDRVMAQMLGQPVPGEVISVGASNLRLLVSLQRLGSMVYTQAAEQWNMLHHLGLSATMNGIASMPRILGEVGRVKRGAPPGNHILTSLETWGGEFGSHSYKMVMPLDPPDGRVETYTNDPGLLSRLLGGGQFVQGKVSFFRAIMATQHRMVAEQIVMKAARYIRDGGQADRWLADMGIDAELTGALRTHIDRIARWDASGKLVSFDITQVPNPAAADAFVQAVHRGVGQIIQRTFVGEQNAWAHNDYLKVLTQLRTFGLTSAEKQWGRVREVAGGGAEGYAYVAGLMVAQTALVLPIIYARVHAASVGREDQQEFIKKNTTPQALVRAAMNYTSISGLSGDALDVITGVAGGWEEALTGERRFTAPIVGGRQGRSAGDALDAIPAAGTISQAGKVATGNSKVYNALKQLPFSNLPYVIPIINLTKE